MHDKNELNQSNNTKLQQAWQDHKVGLFIEPIPKSPDCHYLPVIYGTKEESCEQSGLELESLPAKLGKNCLLTVI